jgi:large subunit ribosomal protein L30
MTKIKVTQTRSKIGRLQSQKRTLAALGLRNQTVEHEATPAIIGMVNKVKHLVSVEEVK